MSIQIITCTQMFSVFKKVSADPGIIHTLGLFYPTLLIGEKKMGSLYLLF